MKLRKTVFASVFLAAALVVSSVATDISASAAEVPDNTPSVAAESSDNASADAAGTAGAAESEKPVVLGMITVETSNTVKGMGIGTIQSMLETVKAQEAQAKWDKTALAAVAEGTILNIRKEASEDSDITGRMNRGDSAEVIEKGDEWTKVVSGDVEGYVRNEYCVFGTDAEAFAAEVCQMSAKAVEDGVRVRSEANTDASIVVMLEEGDTIDINKDAEPIDGWLTVVYDGQDAYVSTDYVDVDYKFGQAVSIEEIRRQEREEREREEAERKAQAAEEAAQKSASAKKTESSGSSDSGSKKSGGYNYPSGSGVLTRSKGVNYYNGFKETYYNLPMDNIYKIAWSKGLQGERWTRDDGVKMFGPYVIAATAWDVIPYGTTFECSLGTAISLDTGTFAQSNSYQVDIAVDW